MTKTEKRNLMIARVNKMESNGKNVKCPGVLKALKREIRNIDGGKQN